MSKKHTTKLNEIYRKDPIAADKKLWGRKTNRTSRRGFLRNSGLVSLSSALGMSIPFARFMPAGLIPAVFAGENAPSAIEGKDCLLYTSPSPRDLSTSRMPSSA